MKTPFILAVLISISFSLHSQIDTSCKIDTGKLAEAVKCVIDNYKVKRKQLVHPAGYLKIIKPIFSRVILNSDDAIKNGNAISFVNDAEKLTISTSTTLLFKNPFRFLNIGFTGNATNDYLFVKNEDKTNYGVAGNITFSRVITSSIFYFEDERKRLEPKLNFFKGQVLAKELKFVSIKTKDLTDAAESLRKLVSIETIFKNNTDKDTTNDITEKKIKEYLDRLKTIEVTLERLEKWKMNTDTLQVQIEEQISDLEAKEAKINGSSVLWWEAGLKPSIQGVAYFDTTLTPYLKKGKDAYPKLSITGSFNYARNFSNYNWFISVGANIFNNYFFEGLKKDHVESFDPDTRVVVAKGFSETNPDKLYYTFDPFVTTFIYPFPKKILGFELSTDYKMSNLRFIHSFNVGILFSIAGSDNDISKGTIGIFLTGKNIDYTQKVGSEFYGYGIRVGLPINKIFAVDK